MRDIPFFRGHVCFSCFRPNPYTRMCVSTIGSYSFFGKKVKTHGKTHVEPCVFGFSQILYFSVDLDNSSRITFPPSGGGSCSRSLRCQKVHEMSLGDRKGKPTNIASHVFLNKQVVYFVDAPISVVQQLCQIMS